MKEMIQYTGTKTVKACPMSRAEAEEILNRKFYKDSEDREDEPGYLVVYPDGYRSWSPEKVFEDAYRISQSYIDRMYNELDEVKARYIKGREFSFSQQFRNLRDEQRKLLRIQLDTMEKYLYILSERIETEIKNMPHEGPHDQAPLDSAGNAAGPLRQKHD